MDEARDIEVYGERVGDLLPGLQRFHASMRKQRDGGYRGHAVLEREEALPLIRALRRVEASC